MLPDWLTWFTGIPILSAILLAVVPFLAPSIRWTRRIKSDLEIAKGLPEGPEREAFEQSALVLARRLHAYRHDFPRTERVWPWLFFSFGAAAVLSGLTWGWKVEAVEVPFLLAAVVWVPLSTWAALSGRSINTGALPEDYLRLRRESAARVRKAERRAKSRKSARARLRRIQKTEPIERRASESNG